MFSCNFFDATNKTTWYLCYNPGFIQINCHEGINLQLNFPENEKPDYDKLSKYRDGGYNTWVDLKTRGFTLCASTRTYVDKNHPEFDAQYDRQGEPSGEIKVYFHATEYTGGHYITFQVPYALAKGLMRLIYGNYDIEGALEVQRA
jgi:hypothetical protein